MREIASTPRLVTDPVVILIGFSEEFVDCMREVASDHSVCVNECSVGMLHSLATQVRPLAIFVPDDLSELERTSAVLVARDVEAQLIEVPRAELPEDRMDLLLRSALRNSVTRP
jgi:hypothetical protein